MHMETLDLSLQSTDTHTRRALADLSLTVAKSKRIVVVTGAGISCSSGIPDFRSSDGLYNLVKERYPHAVLKGRDLFCSSLFRDPTSTSVFYTFIAQLKRSIDGARPSPTHAFLRTLDEKKRLLRSYTQNIDGFEERVGLTGSGSGRAKSKSKGKMQLASKEVRNVQLHGDIHRVRCGLCSADLPCTEEYLAVFDSGSAPDCPECTQRSKARVARSARALKIGSLRPAIVLYDEPHPLGDDIGALQLADAGKRPDMLIVMGTSLKVHGLKALVREFVRAVRAATPASAKVARRIVFVNRTPPPAEWQGVFDYWVKGDTDSWVEDVEQHWRRVRPGDWEMQQTLDGAGAPLKVRKATAPAKGKGKVASKAVMPTPVPPVQSDEEEDENIVPLSSHHDPAPLQPTLRPRSTSPWTASPVSTAPSTPSKRRNLSSHYSRSSSLSPPPSSPAGELDSDSDNEDEDDVLGKETQCSPSKRRTLHRTSGTALEIKRLFADATNVSSSLDTDVFGSPTKPAAKTNLAGKPRAGVRGRAVGSATAARAAPKPSATRKAARAANLPAPLATQDGQIRMEAFAAGGPARTRR